MGLGELERELGDGLHGGRLGVGGGGYLLGFDGSGVEAVGWDLGEEGERGEVQEFLRCGGEAGVNRGSLGFAGLIDDKAGVGSAVLLPEEFEEGVGVGEGRGVWCGDEQGGGGLRAHEELGRGDARGDVDENNGELAGESVEVCQQGGELGLGDRGETGMAGATGDEADVAALGGGEVRDGEENIRQSGLTCKDVGEVAFWLDVKLDIEVGEAGVAIQQQHALALFGQNGGEIEGERGFADAAFTGGYRVNRCDVLRGAW